MKLSVKQAALTARVSESTVYSWCAERMLPHYRLPARRGARGRIQIDERDLTAFIETHKITEQEPEEGPLQFIR